MKKVSNYLVAVSVSAIVPVVVLFSIGMVLNAVVVLGVAVVCFVVGAIIGCKEIEREEKEQLKIMFDTLEKMKENERGQDIC
jgi:ABC-type transport system involved in cytochrome bd biosynthesis fused ATPase/permease subunit